ncbi:cytochrome P450 [Obba rivulosa]|uniref:Cytochrome P450 n=1 Tax=Obba rivulosa TaxID=1052685 RepID=A0A8E2DEV2_9APHY|nr:cytochrome P450 [Obba rivulosa]
MPSERPWLQFAEWAKSYGDIMHLSVLGKSIIILSSPKAVSDLLDKRSSNYSDRPSLPMAGDLVGYVDSLPLCAYGRRHREMRKLFAEVINSRTAQDLYPIQERKTQQFLSRLARHPLDARKHIRWLIASIVFKISHGRDVADVQDPLVTLADQATSDFGDATVPGAFFVDMLPVLRYVPDWMPGTRWKSQAREWRNTMQKLRDDAYDDIVRKVAEGVAAPSFTASLIEENPHRTLEQDNIFRWASVGLYSGGADTTVSAIESFFLSMTLYPDVQRRAQDELDRVVGRTRLPNFGDRSHLPFIEALIREVYRWNPVSPLALPHVSTSDDVYDEYYIPAGSVVIGNSWAIMHNSEVYPEPMKFTPERYLPPHKEGLNPDPRAFAFGYGRRACPGERLADDSLFIVIAMTLAVFDIHPPRNEAGSIKRVNSAYTASAISHPVDLECHITPRATTTEKLLAAIASE